MDDPRILQLSVYLLVPGTWYHELQAQQNVWGFRARIKQKTKQNQTFGTRIRVCFVDTSTTYDSMNCDW